MDENRQSDGYRGARRSLSPFLRRRLERLRLLRRADDAGLPRRLRRNLEASADHWIQAEHGLPNASSPGVSAVPEQPARQAVPHRAARAGWYVAAVCFVLAIAGWWPGIDDTAHGLVHGISPLAGDVERARVHLIDHAGPQLGRWHWQYESGLPADVQGEVVWSAARQEGYLTLVGLPPNERATRQYQLWIVDAARDDRYPVDGGVFDVPAGARKVTVRVQPALAVAQPVMFAVTLERAGGVVVSDRSHLVAVARTDLR